MPLTNGFHLQYEGLEWWIILNDDSCSLKILLIEGQREANPIYAHEAFFVDKTLDSGLEELINLLWSTIHVYAGKAED